MPGKRLSSVRLRFRIERAQRFEQLAVGIVDGDLRAPEHFRRAMRRLHAAVANRRLDLSRSGRQQRRRIDADPFLQIFEDERPPLVADQIGGVLPDDQREGLSRLGR